MVSREEAAASGVPPREGKGGGEAAAEGEAKAPYGVVVAGSSEAAEEARERGGVDGPSSGCGDPSLGGGVSLGTIPEGVSRSEVKTPDPRVVGVPGACHQAQGTVAAPAPSSSACAGVGSFSGVAG